MNRALSFRFAYLVPFYQLILLTGAMLISAGCGHSDSSAPNATASPKYQINNTDPRWVFPRADNPSAKVAVVFIHGIFGDTLGTWTNDENAATFFDLLRSSPQLEGKVDVYAFGFTSKMIAGGSLDVREAAIKLENSLAFDHVWDYPSVVFVAHSMGGLVVIREMEAHREHLDRTPLIVLFATPSQGADITRVGDLFLNNDALKDMRPIDANNFLKLIDDDWKQPPHPQTHVVCAYEKKPVGPILVVPWSSATGHCDEAASPIEDSDHLTIVKPDRPQHPSVVVLVNAINKWVFQTDRNARIDIPEFQQAGQEWNFKVADLNHPNLATIYNRSLRQVQFDVTHVSQGIVVEPKDHPIAGNGQIDLDIILLRGDLLREYSFDLIISPLQWHVNVVLPNAQAVQAQQRALASSLTDSISSYLHTGSNLTKINALPRDQQVRAVIDVTRKAVVGEHQGLSPDVQWLLTADALSSLGWPELGHAALDQMSEEPSQVKQSAAAQGVGARIAALEGKPSDIAWVAEASRLKTEEVTFQAAMNWVNPSSAQEAQRLATSLQSVKALQADGLMLQGDIFKSKGETKAAEEAYFDASKIRRSTITDEKLRDLRGLSIEKQG